jgi:hypothetical protein
MPYIDIYNNESELALNYKNKMINYFIENNNSKLFDSYELNMKATNDILNNHGAYLYRDLENIDIKNLAILKAKSKNIDKEINKYIIENKIKYANNIESSIIEYKKQFLSNCGKIGLIIDVSTIGNTEIHNQLMFPKIYRNQMEKSNFTTIKYKPPKLFPDFPESLRKYVCNLILNEKKLMELGKSSEHNYDKNKRQAKIEALNNELKYFEYYKL